MRACKVIYEPFFYRDGLTTVYSFYVFSHCLFWVTESEIVTAGRFEKNLSQHLSDNLFKHHSRVSHTSEEALFDNLHTNNNQRQTAHKRYSLSLLFIFVNINLCDKFCLLALARNFVSLHLSWTARRLNAPQYLIFSLSRAEKKKEFVWQGSERLSSTSSISDTQ
jgi:hypothetical protein